MIEKKLALLEYIGADYFKYKGNYYLGTFQDVIKPFKELRNNGKNKHIKFIDFLEEFTDSVEYYVNTVNYYFRIRYSDKEYLVLNEREAKAKSNFVIDFDIKWKEAGTYQYFNILDLEKASNRICFNKENFFIFRRYEWK